jgi:hypothetical protein
MCGTFSVSFNGFAVKLLTRFAILGRYAEADASGPLAHSPGCFCAKTVCDPLPQGRNANEYGRPVCSEI